MRLQAIHMYSALDACRVDVVEFTHFFIFTGKLQVTHVNCVWGLFTCSLCSLQVELPAFAGNFARVYFTVQYFLRLISSKSVS